ncbi:MAG: hypothetical protein HYX96_05340 [Chloroflexi bacterium]|nr:hypothetical protein [Chloroflexota bacterium]
MKWRGKEFLVTWLAVYLLAPSLVIHNIFAMTARPPGSPPYSPPLWMPFGGVVFMKDLLGQLFAGDWVDTVVVFLVRVLPFLIYTYILSLLVYLIFIFLRRGYYTWSGKHA